MKKELNMKNTLPINPDSEYDYDGPSDEELKRIEEELENFDEL
jgi:hypothetical protein